MIRKAKVSTLAFFFACHLSHSVYQSLFSLSKLILPIEAHSPYQSNRKSHKDKLMFFLYSSSIQLDNRLG
ncbi:hypothetical protein VCRA2123E76_70145 [Vibrio crassostreae]|nr:hypothetical protein VCRA2123E76_70145 [Vibrio crassostreae]